MMNMAFYSPDEWIPIAEKIQARQKYNRQILQLIIDKKYPISEQRLEKLKVVVESFPQQRFAQLVCNYVFPDYRNSKPWQETIDFMSSVFPNNPDPFYEESVDTFKRLNLEN